MLNVLMTVVISMIITLLYACPTRAADTITPCGTEPMTISIGDLIACQTDGTGDEDIYLFNGQAGNLIIVTLASLDTTKQDRRPLAELRGPDGVAIGNLAPAFGMGTELIVRLTQTGVHRIIVEEDGRNARANYHLGLSNLLPSPPDASSLVFGTGDVAGQISNLGGVDVFVFEAVAGTRVEVQLRDDTPGLARPIAHVYDPRGRGIMRLQPVNERLIKPFNVTRTGRHVVIVFENSHNHLVNYRIRVDCMGDSAACAPVVPLPTCNGLVATMTGTNGDNILEGTPGDDVIVGLDGNDLIYGAGGNDTICGGPGDDILWGSLGNDVLLGEDGSDVLRGGDGEDLLIGGPGEDILVGGDDNDELSGGDGDDVLGGNSGNDVLSGDTGSDVLSGDGGNDVLIGDLGNDSLRGGGGSDQLDGGDDSDICDGETGTDTDTNCEIALNIP